MREDGRSDLGLGSLGRDIAADGDRIRRAALPENGKKGGAARRGRRLATAFAVAFLVLIAVPPFTWPIRGRVTSPFFFRQKPDSGAILDLEFHRGLDIGAASGTNVRATAPGIVSETGTSPELGNFVKVRHLFGVTSTYGHLSRIDAHKGQLILARALSSLGAVGATGRATGPHLHFALQEGGAYLPPRAMLFFHSLRRGLLGF
jgi:murein DD-endopeptidase MepM/ murein hydrolase activator NlpD